MNDTILLVPARLASTRFPEKLLHPVAGRPLLRLVAERLLSVSPKLPVCFAVDDPKLAEALQDLPVTTLLTRRDHPTGTDRLAEANEVLHAKWIVNVQADEPLVTRAQLLGLVRMLESGYQMATLATPIANGPDLVNPNHVKVVVDHRKRALYFSRSVIPHLRDWQRMAYDEWVRQHCFLRHLGLYAYTADLLKKYPSLPRGPLEEMEKLEQLRALENGIEIGVEITEDASIGIDTPEDVPAAEALMQKLGILPFPGQGRTNA